MARELMEERCYWMVDQEVIHQDFKVQRMVVVAVAMEVMEVHTVLVVQVDYSTQVLIRVLLALWE